MPSVSASAPPPYGGYPSPPYQPPRDHPSATTVLVLGIVGLVACQVASPFAWVMGNRVIREIDTSRGQLGGRSTANAGRICGMIGTGLLVVSAVFILLFLVVAVAGVRTGP
jgi:uncharacterized membrane protein YjgN (DUF898 family)